MKSQFCVIMSHLSNETKENLRFQGINLSVTQHKPLFDYISFCRYLNLQDFDEFVDLIDNIEESKISIIRNEILKLFINRNTKITHLYIQKLIIKYIAFQNLNFLVMRTFLIRMI